MTTKENRQSPLSSGLFCFSAAKDWGWLAAFVPLLGLHFRQLWTLQHYQFFPLILLCLPPLLRRLLTHPAAGIPDSPGWLRPHHLRLIAWSLLLMAVIAWSPNVAAVAAVIAIGSVLLSWQRAGKIRHSIAFWCVLWTLVRLPLNLDIELIFRLQGITSRLASSLLDAVHINHVLHGHVIRIPGDGFLVEEACSGIQSLFTLIAFTMVALCVISRSRLHCVALVIAAVIWAALINTIRVAIVVIAAVWFELDISSGTPHEILGMVLFLLAVWMLVSTDSLLLGVSALLPSSATQGEKASSSDVDYTTARQSSVELIHAGSTSGQPASMANLLAFTALGLLQILALVLQQRSGGAINPDDPRIAAALGEETLPEQIGDWRRLNFSQTSRSAVSYMGRNSASWTYQQGSSAAVISVDYPFLGWHELENCYRAQGCIVSDRSLLPARTSQQAVECVIKDPGGGLGQLWYSQFSNTGVPLTPLGNGANTLQYWLSRLQSSFLRQAAAFHSNPGNYQVQLMVYQSDSLAEQEVDLLPELHRRTTEKLVAVIREATE